MQIIPLSAKPNQALTVNLANQITQINVYTAGPNLYMDVLLNNAPVVYGVICQNLNRIIRVLYLGYAGDFAFIDNEGDTDPVYTGLGTRYSLAYIEADELLANEG